MAVTALMRLPDSIPYECGQCSSKAVWRYEEGGYIKFACNKHKPESK